MPRPFPIAASPNAVLAASRPGIKAPAAKISLPVSIAFIVSAQEAVAIRLLINVPPAVNGAVTTSAALVKVRAIRIVVLAAARVACAGEEPVFVTLIVSAPGVTIAPIVPVIVNRRVEIVIGDVVKRAIAVIVPLAPTVASPIPVLVSILVSVTIAVAVPVAISVTISVAILIAILVAIFIAILVAILVTVPTLVPVAASVLITIAILIAATIKVASVSIAG